MRRIRNVQNVLIAQALAVFAVAPALGQTVTFTAAPTSLSFNYQIGSALPAALKLAVRSSSGKPNYTVSLSGTDTRWLTATPDSGTMPASLTVRVNPTSLGVGTYTAQVVVGSTNPPAQVSVPVTLVVAQPLPTLQLSATSLDFTAPPLTPAKQQILLSTTGGPVPFTATASGASWISISPSGGVVLPGGQIIMDVDVDATNLTPQSRPYTAKITIVATGVPSANRAQNVTVNLTVNTSTPTIDSLWPDTMQVNSPATTVTIRGTGFYKGTTVKISGTTVILTPTLLSSTAMLVVIPSNLLLIPGTLDLVASNPAPGGDSTVTAQSTFTVSTNPVVQAAVSVANYQAPVSPGELITLFGSNIGPGTAASMTDTSPADGFADTSLNGVSVTIDGQAAPLIYVSQNQISVQVPYEVTTGSAKDIQVDNSGVIATGTVDIAPTAPGIFSLDSSGMGAAAALNYNSTSGAYTLNAANNPAKIGDIVVLYVTGEGDYATSISPRTGYHCAVDAQSSAPDGDPPDSQYRRRRRHRELCRPSARFHSRPAADQRRCARRGNYRRGGAG